jgi:urease accessory protein
MKAAALLTVERDRHGRTVVRELRSQAPMTLVPRRTAVPAADGAATVHLVGSASSPLGGDRVDLRVRVGADAHLRLRGTAATVALPGQRAGDSRATVRIEVAPGGTVEYLPEPTVVTSRADHHAELRVEMGAGSRARCRETLVLGRHGELPGSLTTVTHVVRDGVPLLRQQLDIGDQRALSSAAYLAGARVLVTETVMWDNDPVEPASGQWWSLVPLAREGALATVLAADTVTAQQRLSDAIDHHPDGKILAAEHW